MLEPASKISVQRQAAIDQLADQFEQKFRDGSEPRIEDFISAEASELRPYMLRELVTLELELRRNAGEQPVMEEYVQRFPDNRAIVEAVILGEDLDEFATTDPDHSQQRSGDDTTPATLGRYVITRPLGQGGFGVVYLAHDPQLDRKVALKVPRRLQLRGPEQVASFIAEARTAAKLKHSSLVAVYDVQEDVGLPFIVQEYIDGDNMGDWSAKHQPSYAQIARIMVIIADALGYLHQRGLTHCDLKLANVLMDSNGQPHVADFGLTLHESTQSPMKGKIFGTPTMMAPEQVRGEGHRLDGRTDIWAVGIMLYQLLVGRHPFVSTSQHELFNEIQSHDPKPLRQIDRSVPRDLERICLKCLSKRRTERYQSADDLQEELEVWLTQASSSHVPQAATVANASDSTLTTPDSSADSLASVKVIPKGLRSFDAEDTDFFLELLPGPRDRVGLPESIRFWKNRIEESDPDKTFSVGLIYGPSGCGKSSLVKAGLLPRLSDQVLSIYVEATADETELRILKQFRKHIPRLPEDISLPDACAELRESGAGRNRKVLVVIDQFEQWLHTHTDLSLTALVGALRQCDGGHLQVILLVRDDFFVSVNRLFRELEDPLVEGRNYALVDRFDRQHACKVLTAFGRAYGKLDDGLSTSQEQFISRAVEELVEEDKVISVRLSLFADMMKMRPWTLKSLTEMGGASGVGVTFLEETFSGKAAPPTHREHQAAIRQVLKTLLPESGTEIKGGMRSAEMLQQASGYGSDQRRFDELLRILDSELRIITPTDPEGIAKEEDGIDKSEGLLVTEGSSSATSPFTLHSSHFYQLTHDYLVPSLREWLTRKQRETRRGRAELKLEERAAMWNAQPQNRHLPSLWEYGNLRLLTNKKNWSEPQRNMMRRTGSVLGVRWGTAVAVLLLIGIAIQQYVTTIRHRNLVERVRTTVASLRVSRGILVPRAIRDLRELPEDLVETELKARYNDSKPLEKLSLAYALADSGEFMLEFLVSLIDDAPSAECPNFVDALEHNLNTARRLSQLAQEADGNRDWTLKGRLAVLALHLGDAALAIDVHADRPEPTQQTVFIHDVLSTWHGELNSLAEVIDGANSASLRAGMCLALGNLPAEQLTDPHSAARWDFDFNDLVAWQDQMKNWYQQSPDSGTHSAAGWALRKWGVELPEIAADSTEPEDRNWKVTPMGREHGFTMVRIAAGKFQRNDGKTEQAVTLTRDLWLSDVEVSVRLFQQFMDDEDYHAKNPELKPKDWSGGDTRISPTDFHEFWRRFGAAIDQHPARQVSWEDAVLFCNWLSQKEGRLLCYNVEPIAKPKSERDPSLTVTLLADGTGYRLPTEAEWEYACRAGTTTDFGFGSDAERLKHYAVFASTKTELVGSKMSNRWGLFDFHGNVSEWCHDGYGEYTGSKAENPTGAVKGLDRVLRGGSWNDYARDCQSGYRYRNNPRLRSDYYGFRVAQVPLPVKKQGSEAESESR